MQFFLRIDDYIRTLLKGISISLILLHGNFDRVALNLKIFDLLVRL